jgi:hypothetical protein
MTIPKLDVSSNNWTIFIFHFQDAIEAKGFWGHFDGSTPYPTPNTTGAPTATEATAITQWEKDE